MTKPSFHWFNPLNHDNRDLYTPAGRERAASPEYRIDAVRAAERLGFESVLCMVGQYCNDAWLAAAALMPQTQTIKPIVAVRTGYTHPAVVAHQVLSFQELSRNRLWLNVVTGSHEKELRAYGDFLDKEARYRRSDEFLHILFECWKGEPFDFHGEFYQVEGAGLPRPLAVRPKVFSGGSSSAGLELAAKYSDVHLSYGEPPPLIAQTVEEVGERAAKHGRTLEFGLKINVIARRTSEEAWREVDRLLAGLDEQVIARQQKNMASRASVGQTRVQAFNPGSKTDPDSLKFYPTMWAGTGLVSGGGSTALVGSFEEVAERIEEYLSVGVRHMLFSAHPLLEGAYEVAEGIFPYFKDRTDVVEAAPMLRASATI
jgi:alkanesulfonate monooxygenase